MQQNIYQGNSVISVETLPEYSHPVVIKKPSKRHPSRRSLRSLEKEYEMTRSLNAVEGVRKVLGQQSIENQPALVLEYIDGETLRDHIGRKTLSLHAKLEIAVDLARILTKIHQQDSMFLFICSPVFLQVDKRFKAAGGQKGIVGFFVADGGVRHLTFTTVIIVSRKNENIVRKLHDFF